MPLYVRAAIWRWLPISTLLIAVGGNGCVSGSSSQPAAGGPLESDAGDDAAPSNSAGGGGIFPADEAGACRPGDVQTYEPGPYHFAAGAWRGLCAVDGPAGNGQDRLFFEKCLAPDATPETCAAFQVDPANADCAKCILTANTAADRDGYGPLINQGTFITTNVAGCLELSDPSALSCAKAVQALSGCELRACEANCPVHDQASRAAYDACATHADHDGCLPYASAAACTSGAAASAPLCFLSSFTDFYYAVVALFCGAPPKSDGGDALSFDASDDLPVEAPAAPPLDAAAGPEDDAKSLPDAKSGAAFDSAPNGGPADVRESDAHGENARAADANVVDGSLDAAKD
jgi:hypothetical protein